VRVREVLCLFCHDLTEMKASVMKIAEMMVCFLNRGNFINM